MALILFAVDIARIRRWYHAEDRAARITPGFVSSRSCARSLIDSTSRLNDRTAKQRDAQAMREAIRSEFGR